MLIVDSREPSGIKEKVAALDIPSKVEMLDSGDFLWWDSNEEPVIVTRKAGDALSSVFSGHFQEELDKIGEFISVFENPHVVFLIEGVWASVGKGETAHFKRAGNYFRASHSHHAPIKTFLGLQAGMVAANIPIVQTTDHNDTAHMLEALYRRSMDGWPTNVTRGLKQPNLRWSWQQDKSTKKVQRLMALWPRLSEPVAFRLLDKFGSVKVILENALDNPKEIRKVQGVGPKLLNNLVEVLE